tara:strand:+ start:1619 stop:1792 length:174 start_codon:yes stop_codon:yes gene_type:complete
MKIHEWKRNELNRLLMEKFNLKEKHCGNHDEEDLEEGHDCAIHAGKTHEEWLEEQSE